MHEPNRWAALGPWGWNGALERELWQRAPEGAEPGRVVARHRGRWDVVIAEGRGTRRIRTGAAAGAGPGGGIPEPPAVGDWVAVEQEPGGEHHLVALLPRSGAFRRRAAGGAESGPGAAPQVVAANVDVALVLASLAEPLRVRRIERYVALAWESGAEPVVVLTKLDRVADAGVDVSALLEAAAGAAPGVEVLAVSARTGQGVDALTETLAPGRTAVLLGPSGVGKSTLLNRLLGEERQRTQSIRRDGKGRHTTTHRELFTTPTGALIIDTPGMREVGLWDAADGLEAAFADIGELAAGCRFRDCAHGVEPGCAVRAAVEEGRLPADRLESWHALRREAAWQERRSDPLAAAEEDRRWKAIHRSMRAHVKRRERGE